MFNIIITGSLQESITSKNIVYILLFLSLQEIEYK